MTEYVVRLLVGAPSYRPLQCSATSAPQELRRSFWSSALGRARHARTRGVPARGRLRSPSNSGDGCGSDALAVYTVGVYLLVRAKLRAVTATLLSLVVWLILAFGALIFAGGPA
jgi:hypothetical protein